MPLPDPRAERPANLLVYSPVWMDSVFTSRQTIEALLAPEREAGYITPHDYDVSIKFLSNSHRYYPIMSAIFATGLVYSLRSPKWNPAKSASMVFTCGFGGYALGRMSYLQAHFAYLRSIENPHGFQKAMEHIQTQVGSPKGGVVIERPYQISPEDMDPDQLQENVPQLVLPKVSDPSPSVSPPTRRTKWDEIRAANSRNATNSSWDKLRQNHERKDAKSHSTEEETLWTGDALTEKVDADPYAARDFNRGRND